MDVNIVLLKTVVIYFSLIRRLYLEGKISRDDWHDINDAFTQFLQQEIDI